MPPSRDKVHEHRARLRAQGLRAIQIKAVDARLKKFKTEARRKSLAIAQSVAERGDQVFVDSLADWD